MTSSWTSSTGSVRCAGVCGIGEAQESGVSIVGAGQQDILKCRITRAHEAWNTTRPATSIRTVKMGKGWGHMCRRYGVPKWRYIFKDKCDICGKERPIEDKDVQQVREDKEDK